VVGRNDKGWQSVEMTGGAVGLRHVERSGRRPAQSRHLSASVCSRRLPRPCGPRKDKEGVTRLHRRLPRPCGPRKDGLAVGFGPSVDEEDFGDRWAQTPLWLGRVL
jgi:hypothetical protein